MGDSRQRRQRPVAVTIAGSDSSGGAGIQADLKTFQALGVYGMSVITAVTAQNTVGVRAVHELPASLVADQLDAVAEDIGADAVKTGMLSSAAIIGAVADGLQRWRLQSNLVVDPVMVAKSGDRLLREDAVHALVRDLLPLAAVVTPNLPEAEVLVGHPIRTPNAVHQAAREIVDLGPRAVLMKGGHAEAPDAVDVLFDGHEFYEFSAPRMQTPNTHGTGCTLSSAIASNLAQGLGLRDAVGAAKRYLTQAIRTAASLGSGHGPVNHDWLLSRPALSSLVATPASVLVGGSEAMRAALRLYLIADTSLVPADRMPEAVGAAIRGGVTLVQLRAKNLSTLQCMRLAEALVQVCHAAGVPFVVDDRVDVALGSGADGVHVGHVGVEDMSPRDARRLLGPLAIIGVSVGSGREARSAEESGAVNYVSAGPMFATTTKTDAGPAAGDALLRDVRAATRLPMTVIGGIGPEAASNLLAAGADGICVGAAILGAPDPEAAARSFPRLA